MVHFSQATRADLRAPFAAAIEACRTERGEEGLQLAIYQGDDLVLEAWDGLADLETGAPVTEDTLFSIFSISKSIAAFALHVQAERGLIDYDEPVSRYWPEFGAAGKETATVQHVLDHQAGVYQMPIGTTIEDMCDFDLMTARIAALPPLAAPGTQNACMVLTFGWIVAELVRRTDPRHRSFSRFLREEITEPLGIDDLWIGLPSAKHPQVARLIDQPAINLPADHPAFKALPPALSTRSSSVLRTDYREASVPGSNGLANARSVAKLYAVLANEGELNGVRLLSRERVERLRQPRPNTQEVDLVYTHPVRVGNGFWTGGNDQDINYGRLIGSNPNTIGHPGNGGTVAWGDRDAEISVAICHNRLSSPIVKALDPIRDVITATFNAP